MHVRWIVCVVPLIVQACGGDDDRNRIDPISGGPDARVVFRIDGHAADLVPIAGFRAPNSMLAVSATGFIAVAQAQDYTVLIFDQEGTARARAGAKGSGPGEFSVIDRVGWRADTLWVFDTEQSRMSLFTVDGAYTRSVAIPRTAELAIADALGAAVEFSTVKPLALLENDIVLVAATANVGAAVPLELRDHALLGYLSQQGSIASTMAWVPLGQIQLNTASGEAFVLPFPNRVERDASPSGNIIAFAAGIIEGDSTETLRVVTVGESGDTLYDRRHRFAGVEIPRLIRDSIRRLYDLPVPEIYPPLTGVIVSPDSAVWIELLRTDEGRPYLVLSANGDLRGRVVVPTNLRVAEARGQRLWAIEVDEVGIESVIVLDVAWR